MTYKRIDEARQSTKGVTRQCGPATGERPEGAAGAKRFSIESLSTAAPRRAATPIILGIAFLAVAVAAATFLPMRIAAPVLGVLVSAAVCYVIIVAMPRATQVSLMGAAIGVSADASYAKLSDQTPVTIANGLVKLADALTKSIGLVAADAQVSMVAGVTPYFVWAFINPSISIFVLFIDGAERE
jgi:hypothetical protein